MTDLTVPDNMLVHPVTGEAKALADLTDSEVREGIKQLDALADAVTDARKKLARHVWDRKNAGSAVAGVEVSQSRQWRTGDTVAALDKLIHDGVIEEACREYVVPQTTYKANTRSLNALVDYLIAQGRHEAASILLSARRDSVKAKVVAP